jgi:hypothetical protein
MNRVSDRTMCDLVMYFRHLRPSLYD